MKLSITHGFLSAPVLHGRKVSKQEIYDRIENQLTRLGWRLSGSNPCTIECRTHIDLGRILTQLKKLGITSVHLSDL